METLIVKIKNQDKVAFTKELLQSFKFLEVSEEKKIPLSISAKRKTALIKGFKEIKLIEAGKLKGITGSDLLKKLRNEKI